MNEGIWHVRSKTLSKCERSCQDRNSEYSLTIWELVSDKLAYSIEKERIEASHQELRDDGVPIHV